MDNYKTFNGFKKTGIFAPFDYLTLIVGFSLLSTSIYLSLTYKENTSSTLNLKPIAEILSIKNGPKRKVVGTLSFNPIQGNEKLFKGDQILTDDNDSVEISIQKKSFLSIPSNTLIKISIEKGEYDIELVKGFVDLKLSKKVKSVNVRKGKKVYKVKSKKGTGKVQIVAAKKQIVFNAIEGNDLELQDTVKKAPAKKIEPLKGNYKIISPKLGQQVDPNKADFITLKVSKIQQKLLNVREKTPVRNPKVVISKFANFQKSKKFDFTNTDLLNGKKLLINSPGTYYIGLEEEKNNIYNRSSFEVLPFATLSLVEPEENKVIKALPNSTIPISWSGVKGKDYVLEYKVGDTTKTIQTKENTFAIPITSSGLLAYRVKIDNANAPWSNWSSRKIELKKGITVDKTITPDLINQIKPVTLSIKSSLLDKKGYEFIISKKKDLKKVILKKKQKSGQLKWKNMKPGEYYWKAQSISYPDQTTEIQKIIVKSPAVKVLSKNNKNYFSTDKKPTVTLNWKEIIKNQKYKITILDSNNRKIKEKTVRGNSSKVTLPSLGSYKWYIASENKNPFLERTKPQRISVTLPLEIKEPKIRMNQVMEFDENGGQSSYRIELPKYKHIKEYYIEIYSDKKMKKVITRKKTKNPYILWVSEKSGEFYYRVKVTDKWNRESDFSKLGSLIFPISPFVD